MAQVALNNAKPRVQVRKKSFLLFLFFSFSEPVWQAVFNFLRNEVLSAAADGSFETAVSVQDAWYYDAVCVKLVQDALAHEGVAASFHRGTWKLGWH